MKDVKVLGPGCAKCQELLSQTQRGAGNRTRMHGAESNRYSGDHQYAS